MISVGFFLIHSSRVGGIYVFARLPFGEFKLTPTISLVYQMHSKLSVVGLGLNLTFRRILGCRCGQFLKCTMLCVMLYLMLVNSQRSKTIKWLFGHGHTLCQACCLYFLISNHSWLPGTSGSLLQSHSILHSDFSLILSGERSKPQISANWAIPTELFLEQQPDERRLKKKIVLAETCFALFPQVLSQVMALTYIFYVLHVHYLAALSQVLFKYAFRDLISIHLSSVLYKLLYA